MMPNEADLRAYATGFYRRYGAYAVRYARDHAQKLRDCGDEEGYQVWQRVAERIADGDLHERAA
jgi:hypothetical protein